MSILAALSTSRRPNETAMEAAERLLVQEAMQATGGNQKKAAALLGVSGRMMNYYCERYEMRPKDRRIA